MKYLRPLSTYSGDAIRLKIGLKEHDWVIVGIFQICRSQHRAVPYTNYEYLARQTGVYGRPISYRIVADGEQLNLDEQEELAHRIETHLTDLGYEINDVRRAIPAGNDERLNILTTFLLIMSFLLAAVGTSVMGTMSLM
jgi:hypothetical protein